MKARVLDAQVIVYADKDLNSPQVGGLFTGNEIELGEVAKNKGMKWVAVTLPKGVNGYIRGDVELFTIKRVLLLQKEVEVREQPFTLALVRRKLTRGEQFDQLDIVESDNRKWIKIRDLQGQEGYIDGKTSVQERLGRVPRSPMKNMLVGVLLCGGGFFFAAAFLGLRQSVTYYIALAAILFGGLQFFKGFFQLLRRK